jgi:hypothetical protein
MSSQIDDSPSPNEGPISGPGAPIAVRFPFAIIRLVTVEGRESEQASKCQFLHYKPLSSAYPTLIVPPFFILLTGKILRLDERVK